MKPDGRALDIAAIGLGQAGGNLAAELARRGYRTLALNTAQTDLAALEPGGLVPALPPDCRLYIGLDGYDGAGADPSYGRDCIRAHADQIRTHVQQLGEGADAVLICAGLGGGTGSSLATLAEVLEEEQLPLIGLMTLPTSSESGLAKVNAVRTVNEAVEANLLGWIFVDNDRLAALNPHVPLNEYYAHINGQIIEPLDALNGLNARDNLRPIRSFDGEDFRKLLLAGGILNYGFRELDALSVDTVVAGARACIEASDLMPEGFDITRVSYLGLIVEAPSSALAGASISTFEEIYAALKRETDGAAIYPGIYRAADGAPTVVRLIAVTQSLPKRVRRLLDDAKREGQQIGAKIKQDLPPLELGEVQAFDLFRTHARPTERPRRARARAGSGIHDGAPMNLPEAIAPRGRADLPAKAPVPEPPVAETPVAEAPVAETPAAEPPVGRAPAPKPPVAEVPVGRAPAPEPSVDGAPAPEPPIVRARAPEPPDVSPPEPPPTVRPHEAGAPAVNAPEPPPPPPVAEDEARAAFEAAFEAALDRPEPPPAVPAAPSSESPPAFPAGLPRPSSLPDAPTEAGELPRALGRRRRPGPIRPPRLPVPETKPLGTAPIPEESLEGPDIPILTRIPDPLPSDRGGRPLTGRRLPPLASTKPSTPSAADLVLSRAAPMQSPERAGRSELGTDEIDLVAEIADLKAVTDEDLQETKSGFRRPPAPDPDADTGDLPNPAYYKKLVAEYWSTHAERRGEIAQELEEDSMSENSSIRYYAVEAMAALGRSTFGHALLAATDDEDEAVRNLAVQALRS